MRLNQFIAKATGISRRKADDVIKSKRVKVNGTLGELSYQVQPSDEVEYFDGKNWQKLGNGSTKTEVLLMYKPQRVMTTASDPEGRKTVYDLVPQQYKGYKTAGRLDYMSEGLLVLSPNGHMILSLTHPKFKTKKVYAVGLDSPLSAKQIQTAASGTMVVDNYKLNPVTINKASLEEFKYLNPEAGLHWYLFTLSEGRNRQIRKIVERFNKKVIRLIRVQHGPFKLNKLIKDKGYILKQLTE